jgi:lipopolysaccharide export system ATP-binding protein
LLILLDEPFTGIDPITIAEIRGIVKELKNQGIGVLLTDHNVREALKITTRSYLIKDGRVRTHGTPHEIVRDPIAISEYLGSGFNDDQFDNSSAPQATPASSSVGPPTLEYAGTPAKPAPNVIHNVLEQEKIQRLIEGLKTPDHAHAAAELAQRGAAAITPLLAALERRDVEVRRQAAQTLQAILKRPVAFDPYAPEALRRQQLTALREQYERKAG